jgi:hypothetical protein
VLRSALYNEQTMMSYKARRFTSKVQAQYETLKSLDALADAMSNALTHIAPLFREFA